MTCKLTEARTQAEILIMVTALPGAMFWRMNTGAGRDASGRVIRFGLPGTPDILGCWNGRAIGIEVKSPTGRQSHEQKLWQAQWARAGGLYVLARSVDDVLIAFGLLHGAQVAA